MTTNLIAAATVAALLSATTAIAADQNSLSQYAPQGTTAIKSHPTMPIAIRTTPASIEINVRDRRRAALATLLLIGATAPCLRASGTAFIAHSGC